MFASIIAMACGAETGRAGAQTIPSGAFANRTACEQSGGSPVEYVLTRLIYTETDTHKDTLAWKIRVGGTGWSDAASSVDWLAQIRTVSRTSNTAGKADSGPDFGFGDVLVQAKYDASIDDRWAYDLGARLDAPTASGMLGTGKWQILPILGVRYALPELGADSYIAPEIRYAFSFAGDPSRRSRNEAQIEPTVNASFADNWFVTLYPSHDIRINNGPPVSRQTGRLFLPFDFAAGKDVTDKLVVSLEAGVPIVKDYPVYTFKTQLWITIKI